MADELDTAQTAAYLARLGRPWPAAATAAALAELHLAHLRTIPFENLDIHWGTPITLELPAVFDKVVERGRGGYCYEVNSLFAALLRRLGYDVTLASAQVARGDGTWGPDFDHLALLVTTADGGDRRVADVGFGDAFLRPLPLAAGVRRTEQTKAVGLDRAEAWTYGEDRGDGWGPQYRFAETARELDEFAPMNHWQQTSPDSNFTRRTVASLATAEGRITLSGDRLIETRHGRREEVIVDDVDRVLRERFGIVRG